jgi:hypothetical protein
MHTVFLTVFSRYISLTFKSTALYVVEIDDFLD